MLYLVFTGSKIVLALKINQVVERTAMLSVLIMIRFIVHSSRALS